MEIKYIMTLSNCLWAGRILSWKWLSPFYWNSSTVMGAFLQEQNILLSRGTAAQSGSDCSQVWFPTFVSPGSVSMEEKQNPQFCLAKCRSMSCGSEPDFGLPKASLCAFVLSFSLPAMFWGRLALASWEPWFVRDAWLLLATHVKFFHP